MVKKHRFNFSPAEMIGISSATGFYALCFFKTAFLFALLGFCTVVYALFPHTAGIKKRFLLCVCAGVFAALFSYFKLLAQNMPPEVLCRLGEVSRISVCLKGEPVPTGGNFHKAEAKLISCSKSGAVFSASGKINLFIPSILILENAAGGIGYSKNTGDACKIFAKGVILSCEGSFSNEKKALQKQAFFVSKKNPPSFIAWDSPFNKIRGFLRFHLMQLLYGFGDAGAFLLALLSANKDFIKPECIEIFKDVGLAHILALSGMHVSVISLAAIRISRVFSRKRFSICFAALTVLFFVWFAGAMPSLTRALGMMLLLILGRFLDLRPEVLPVLAAMFIFHLIAAPSEALSLSFILSYGALAGILLFGEAFSHYLKGRLPDKLLSGFAASAGAQFFTAPVIIGKIGKAVPAGVIASFIISPMVSLFLTAGIICIILSLCCPFLFETLNYFLNAFYSVIFYCTSFFSNFFIFMPQSYPAKIITALLPFLSGLICFAFYKGTKEEAMP